MHIFIDESGSFVLPMSPKSKVSSVTALIIPDQNIDTVYKSFISLKSSWGYEGEEVKGSNLSEKQISDVITLLRNNDVLVEVVCLDVGHHSIDGIEKYKQVQADKILEHITDEHQESLVSQANDFHERLIKLPNQLFIQAMITIQLVKHILNSATLYYSQIIPKELSRFIWEIDAKDSNVDKTNFEEIWSTLLLPILETNYNLSIYENGDYSHFTEYEISMEGMENHHIPLGDNAIGGVDIKKLISDELTFEDSSTSIGLQLVDIVSSAFNRAMNGNLKIKGWRHLGSLMANVPTIVLLDVDSLDDPEIIKRHANVITKLQNNKKKLILL